MLRPHLLCVRPDDEPVPVESIQAHQRVILPPVILHQMLYLVPRPALRQVFPDTFPEAFMKRQGQTATVIGEHLRDLLKREHWPLPSTPGPRGS